MGMALGTYDNTDCARHCPDGTYNRYAACRCVATAAYTPTCTTCDDEGTVECPVCDGEGVLDDGDTDCDGCDAGSVPCPSC